ncbi:MAG: HYR domain-containing protein [Phycisphaerae bacterium]
MRGEHSTTRRVACSAIVLGSLCISAFGQVCGTGADCTGLNTPCTVGVCNIATGLCEPQAAHGGACADADGDGDVDLSDYAAFCTCSPSCGGFDAGGASGCEAFDFDNDGHIDLADWAWFQQTFTGEICPSGSQDPLCTPTLNLTAEPSGLPDESCFNIGQLIRVRIEKGPSAPFVVGGQFFLEYDTVRLAFVDIEPGDPPFTFENFESIDLVGGTIDYSVATDANHPGTSGPATMAVITFQAIANCSAFVNFRSDLPPTILSDGSGRWWFPTLGDLSVAIETLPDLNCPEDITVNADAGGVTAVVSWDPPTVSGGCDGPGGVTCTSAPVEGLDSGSTFPSGVTTITCSAPNSCGATGTCSFDVEVTLYSEMVVDIELSPTMAPGPFTRCITFELGRCGVSDTTIRQEITFGAPFAVPGFADNVVVLVPAGTWDCVTARDELHTLRSTAGDFRIEGTEYTASFTGHPDFGGNWLIGGNLDGDDSIDIADFTIFSTQFGPIDPNTDCSDPGPHADINGDGIVDVSDVDFIAQNFFTETALGCCEFGRLTQREGPVASISVQELKRRGFSHPADADLNGDGVVDLTDMELFIATTPGFDKEIVADLRR